MKQIVLAGVGGQGIILAAKILAKAALDSGFGVRSAETIGMAQRGGSVLSHLRIADAGEEIFSSMVDENQADLILGFETGEAVRAAHLVSPRGTIIASNACIIPTSASGDEYSFEAADAELKRLQTRGVFEKYLSVDAKSACEKCASSKVLNTVMLGAAVKSDLLGFSVEQIIDAMQACVRPEFIELNRKAIELGLE